MAKVEKGNTVKVHYTGKLSDGTVFDSSDGGQPLEFKVGDGNLIPGFENGVVGMEVDDTKTVVIPSNEAYGEAREDLIMEVPKDNLPAELTPEIGMELVSKQPDGQEVIVKIVEVKENSIKIDANHQLAGKDLTFEIRVVEIA